MTKAEIVNEIAKSTGIDKQTVLTTLEAFMDSVKTSLSNDEKSFRNTTFRHLSQQRRLLFQ